MKTPYLDAAIKLHEKASEINKISDGGKEALIEFKAIKEALKVVSNSVCLSVGCKESVYLYGYCKNCVSDKVY